MTEETGLMEITVEGEKYTLNLRNPELDDLVDVEKIFGKPYHAIPDEAWNSALGTKTMIFLAKRQVDSSFTFEDAGKVRIDKVDFSSNGTDRPTSAAKRGKRRSTRATSGSQS